MANLLCMQCGETTTSDDLDACPSCGDKVHPPANLDDTVTVTLARHELRILTFWADSFARQSECTQKAMRIILDRLATQTDTALTMSQEIADLRAAFGDVQVTDSHGRELDL
jgi:NMD protein affecting ribosome stability and mRNA decay